MSLSQLSGSWASPRLFVRKLKSAATVYRHKGISALAHLAQIRASAFYRANRPVPADTARRTLMLARTLNRWSGVSPVTIDRHDVAAVRHELLRPYLRQRFAAVGAAGLRCERLSPVETAIVADCLLTTWNYHSLDGCLQAFADGVAGTEFARRLAQTARWTALRLGRLDEAASPIADDFDDMGSLILRGIVADARGRMEEASSAFTAAVRRDAADPYARELHGFHLLKAGRIHDGLASWLLADTLSGVYPLRRRPRWTGEPLGSRRLMVLFEHGLGDMIQMARFLPRLLIREPRATVLARVPVPLLGLMARTFPGVAFVTDAEAEPDYDLFVPSMHLCTVLDAPDLEPRNRYIRLGQEAAGRQARPRIGICWRGHPRQYEATRSVALELFATLFTAVEADFVVLLNRTTPDEKALLSDFANVEMPVIEDFSDLAGIVESCDVVVSVDTAVAHLAAAGGRPVLLLSRPDSCWRWGASGPRSPWYDTVEVLRHGGDMDWPGMMARAGDLLRQRCGQAPADAGP